MRAPAERILELLRDGEMELLGLMPEASNYTFAATVESDGVKVLAIYKPKDGERPLWDFPRGTLYQREVAAYLVSETLGWHLVPPTIAREGPHGIGSVQLFINAVEDEHYLTLMPEHADLFRRVCALDVVINNADRKSTHCLLEQETGRMFVFDHGVCFHVEDKLRTVIWDFVGEPLPDDIANDLRALDTSVLEGWLAPEEIEETRARAAALAKLGTFPNPPEDRRAIPWPPY